MTPWRWPSTSSAESDIAGVRRWSGAGLWRLLRAGIPPDARAKTAIQAADPRGRRAGTHREFRSDGRHLGHPFTEYSRNGAPYPKLEVTLLCERRQLLLEMAIKKSSDRLVTESI